MHSVTVFGLVILVLSIGHVLGESIPDPPLCPEVVNERLELAQRVRQLGGCGYDLSDPSWSLDRAVQTNSCLLVDDEIIKRRTEAMRYQAERCSYCRAYANGAQRAARDNLLNACGFTGDRWGTNSEAHFGWCMTASKRDRLCVLVWGCKWLYYDWDSVKREVVEPETAARLQAVEECKLTTRCTAACHTTRSISGPIIRGIRARR